MRILVDGYSLLYHWPELAAGQPRHGAVAREALIDRLTQYRDVTGTPMTVIFDGFHTHGDAPKPPSTPEMEVLFSKPGQTADDCIERATAGLRRYGEVLVVTNDLAERETIASLGAHTSSCEHFIQEVESALTEFRQQLKTYNRRERGRFNRPSQ